MRMSGREIIELRGVMEDAYGVDQLPHSQGIMKLVYVSRTATGTDVARHLDNAPLDPFAQDRGFTTTEYSIQLPCVFLPQVKTTHNLVQEGYHPDSDVEVAVKNLDLMNGQVKVGEIRTRFKHVNLNIPNQTDKYGRPLGDLTQQWEIMSVRPITAMSNHVISVVFGLALSEPNTKIASGDQ